MNSTAMADNPTVPVQQRTFIRWGLILLVILLPALETVFLVNWRLGPVTGLIPHLSDEVNYWHETLTYIQVGFNGGYYTINELPPAAQFTHFYTHGPWYSLLYGNIGKIIGWELYTPILINMTLVMLALALFLLTLRLSQRQIVLVGLLMLTYWPVLLYVPIAMQENLQQFFAIVLAAVFVVVLEKRQQVSIVQRVIFILFLFAASVTRMSWGILFLPLFMLTGPASYRGWLVALLKSIIAMALVFVITQQVGAPGNNSIFMLLGTFSVSIGYGLQSLSRYIAHNIQLYFSPDKKPVDMLLTFQVLSLLIAWWLSPVLLKRRWLQTLTLRLETYFHIFNIGGILIASLALYIIGTMGDYRVIGLHLLLSLLVLIVRGYYRPVLFVIVTSLICLPIFIETYTTMSKAKFEADRVMMSNYRDILHQQLVFDSETTNSWCNTLVHSVTDFGPLLTGVPAGIGETFFREPSDPQLPFKSQYLLLTEESYNRLLARTPQPRLEYLATLPNDRQLYRNLDANCGE